MYTPSLDASSDPKGFNKWMKPGSAWDSLDKSRVRTSLRMQEEGDFPQRDDVKVLIILNDIIKCMDVRPHDF